MSHIQQKEQEIICLLKENELLKISNSVEDKIRVQENENAINECQQTISNIQTKLLEQWR